jgi:hypothetical protein
MEIFSTLSINFQLLKITFVKPEDYRGAKMESWGPRRNRSLPLYIRPDDNFFPLTPNRSVLTGCRILVVVHSTLNAFKARDDVRNSWLKFDGLKELGIAVIFLVGTVRINVFSAREADHKFQKLLIEEQQKNGDILQENNP